MRRVTCIRDTRPEHFLEFDSYILCLVLNIILKHIVVISYIYL